MANRTGSVKKHRGRWTARITWLDPVTGERREIRRVAKPNTKVRACELRDELLDEQNETGWQGLDRETATFADLARYFVETYATIPEYRDGRKIAGMRSWHSAKGHAETLAEIFGRRLLRSISFEDLRRCRLDLVRSTTVRGTPRSVANVNRIMSVARRMFNIALREGWILRNPFAGVRASGVADSLIPVADETHRERVLTRTEETRLLAACDDPRRVHLRPIIICALDTGMRRGEIFKLRWEDVDLSRKVMRIEATHTKTLKRRDVGITDRLAAELERMRRFKGRASLVFGVTDTVKRSFATACRIAGIKDLRFHDLRHTAATRLIQAGLGLAEVARILGHSHSSMTYRYTNLDERTIERAREALNSLEASGHPTPRERANIPN
jgi:integrase